MLSPYRLAVVAGIHHEGNKLLNHPGGVLGRPYNNNNNIIIMITNTITITIIKIRIRIIIIKIISAFRGEASGVRALGLSLREPEDLLYVLPSLILLGGA